MSDLIERLNERAAYARASDTLYEEAAAELERLLADAESVRAAALEEAARVCGDIAEAADESSVPGSDADGSQAWKCSDAIRAIAAAKPESGT